MKTKGITDSAQVRSDRISFCLTSNILAVMWQMYELGKTQKEFMVVIVQAEDHGDYRFWQRRKAEDRDQRGGLIGFGDW